MSETTSRHNDSQLPIAAAQGPTPTELLTKRVVSINLTNPENLDQCPFWVGAFRKGSALPSELFLKDSVEKIMADADASGLSELEPVMLADTAVSPARFVYLLPVPLENSEEKSIELIISAIRAWAPKEVGFYFAPDQFSDGQCLEFVMSILAEVIRQTKVASIYLMPGQHGVNAVLNAALKVKFRTKSDHLEVRVFH